MSRQIKAKENRIMSTVDVQLDFMTTAFRFHDQSPLKQLRIEEALVNHPKKHVLLTFHLLLQ
jgi:hypothetical protein